MLTYTCYSVIILLTHWYGNVILTKFSSQIAHEVVFGRLPVPWVKTISSQWRHFRSSAIICFILAVRVIVIRCRQPPVQTVTTGSTQWRSLCQNYFSINECRMCEYFQEHRDPVPFASEKYEIEIHNRLSWNIFPHFEFMFYNLSLLTTYIKS